MAASALDGEKLHGFLCGLLDRYGNKPGSVLNILNDIQEEYRYIPVVALYELSVMTDSSYPELCSVVSVFENLTTEPVGRHLVLVCDGTACHAAGSRDIIRLLEDKLGIACGQTTQDGEITLKSVYCVGACSLAPIVIADDSFCGHVRLSELDKTLANVVGSKD